MQSNATSINKNSSSVVQKFLPYGLLLLISALVYLPFIHQFGYYFDDWYFMYAGSIRGASVFKAIWSVDRPGGALLMQPLYTIFGPNALYYNLSAYLFRLLSAFGVLAIGRLIWPRAKAEMSAIALLYLIYPGFLSQPNGIVYQFYFAGLAAATWSIAMTIEAVTVENIFKRVWYFALSILLGLFYLAQIEWFIGFEVIRWAFIFLVVYREKRSWWPAIRDAVKRGWPAILSPALFLYWRLFIFYNTRGATDVDTQVSGLFTQPFQTLFGWAISLVQSVFNTLLTAWVLPLTKFGFSMDTLYIVFGLLLGLVAITLWYFGSTRIANDENSSPKEDNGWATEIIWIGLIALVFGVAPVTLANRVVAFPSYSRYTLVSSLGAAMIIVVGLSKLPKKRTKGIVFSTLILIAALTHYGNNFEYAKWANAYRNFWWQVNWRAPQLEKHTTLAAHYAIGTIEEDYFIWGPANLMYYPDGTYENPDGTREPDPHPVVYAVLLNQDTVMNIFSNVGQSFKNRRTIRTYQNYQDLLILTQPSAGACVHVIDGEQPEYSKNDSATVRILGPYSTLDHILINEPATIPPQVMFGPEPEHNWCYYYQAASLARQRGEWEEVARLGEEAQAQGFAPADLIEWMPFIQAYVELGDTERLTELAKPITTDFYTAAQACQFMTEWRQTGSGIPENVLALYCIEAE